MMILINPDFIIFLIQETTNEDLILVNDSSTNHTFFHNYPSNPHIHAVRVFSGKNYSQSYKIISLGRYPTKVKYTKKEKVVAHKIPDNYQIETMLNRLTVLCKTQYQFSRKVTVKYTIERVDENGQKESRYSLSSAGAQNMNYVFSSSNAILYL
ncbi:6555_t:CDS:2 [Rhizophagus irregularis]|nr:6555_t:CDS:2 [Rhizophagus irregularis]